MAPSAKGDPSKADPCVQIRWREFEHAPQGGLGSVEVARPHQSQSELDEHVGVVGLNCRSGAQKSHGIVVTTFMAGLDTFRVEAVSLILLGVRVNCADQGDYDETEDEQAASETSRSPRSAGPATQKE